ncbi:MAG TPA: endonuclease III [Candidatus Kryptonia bacterium]|nr:endonuclease III [Candidatus Kryptonia bacterium]
MNERTRRAARKSTPGRSSLAARPAPFDIDAVIAALRRESPKWNAPVVTFIAIQSRDPFRVLVSCLLSLRTKDETTGPASQRLFALADTPQAMLTLSARQIEKAIYPVGFYRTKAKTIRALCKRLVDEYGGRVPDDLDTLLTFNGVGRKTANLVLIQGFGKPGMCVDTHVHRISNRWNYVRTKNPHDTEMALRRKLPPEYWLDYNDLLVAFGQTICKPTSPLCSRCPIERYCPKRGVTRSR